jgi:BTB/POZ domain
MIPFNVKKHSDITITVSGDGSSADGSGGERTFYLHKFPLISKSLYFDENIPESAASGVTEMIVKDFPGGPSAFEIVAKYCYGIDIELTVDNIAHVYCASRVLRVPDLEKSTDAFMSEVVLRDPAKAAVVLKVATGIANMSDAMMEGLVGHCINAIASMFSPLPELNALPADCFSCIVRTARDMDANKRTLEAAVVSFLDSHIGDDAHHPAPAAPNAPAGANGPVKLTIEEFLDVVAAPGRMDDMRHAEAIYNFLEVLLRHYRSDSEAESLCKGLHELGFWVCLPHVVIERAYSDRNIPDRYCTVALMAENRHLIKVSW